MSDPAKRPAARTHATRAKIIATAEELFAEKGVASVSLNEITRASGQKNRNAVHYHFGSKEALIKAIFEKHAQPIAMQRNQRLDHINGANQTRLEEVVAALVRPVSARFEDPDGGLAYIKISAQLAATNVLRYFHAEGEAGSAPDYWPDMNRLWTPFLRDLPGPLRYHRMSLMVGMLFHGLADHAVFRDSDEPDLANTELMVCNLIDSICAMLRAPVSAQTAASLAD